MSRQHVRGGLRARGGRLVPAIMGAALTVGVTVAGAIPAEAATATGPDGQTLTASKVSGLKADGDTITLHGEGYDLGKGIYVVVCVNNGAGQLPTPCLGGADMSGGGGTSSWISSNPPSYGEGLATPFTESGGKGSFDVQLSVGASDEFTDCLDAAVAPNGCVVGTRADHTRTADRSADVLIPITFAAANGGGEETSGDASGATPKPNPTATATTGAAGGTAGGAAGGANGAGGKDLAATGAPVLAPVIAALALTAAGAGFLAQRRRNATPSLSSSASSTDA